MRILRTFFVYSVVLLMLGGAGFLITREVLLFMAVSQVKTSLNTLQRTAANTGVYAQQCREFGVTEDTTAAVEAVQLRFDSPTSYVLEVICSQFSLNPIKIETKELPPFTAKTIGSSGLIWNQGLTGIGIEIWGRSRGIFAEAGDIWYGPAEDSIGLLGPATTCAGHGYTCCQSETSQGSGTSISEVTDCPRSCYEQCQLRPLVLSVVSQPFYDPVTRVLSVESGQSVEIGYVIDPQGSEQLQVRLAFGDGEIEEFSDFQGRASHTYTCQSSLCEYTISLQATNEHDITSAVTSISQMKVQVVGR